LHRRPEQRVREPQRLQLHQVPAHELTRTDMPIDPAEARARAQDELDKIKATHGLAARLYDEPGEYGWCWVFGFNSERWFQTRDFGDALYGFGPIVVNKADGTVWTMGTATPVEDQLAAYAAEHGIDDA